MFVSQLWGHADCTTFPALYFWVNTTISGSNTVTLIFTSKIRKDMFCFVEYKIKEVVNV